MVCYEDELKIMLENEEITFDRYCEVIDSLMFERTGEKKKSSGKLQKEFLEKLKDIKKNKPTEYDGPEEIKTFVDKYYDDIVKASDFIETEPSRLRRKNIISTTTTIILIIGGVAWLIASGGTTAVLLKKHLSLLLPVFGLLNQSIHGIIHYLRSSRDKTIVNNLSKIKKALKKIKTDKLPDNYKKKVKLMIDAIEDAETDGIERVKVAEESVREEIETINQRYMESEITYTERDEMIDYIINNKNVIQ